MIRAIYIKNGAVNTEHNSLTIAQKCKDKADLTWIDIHLEQHGLSQQETALLSETFRFHEMSIEDCLFPQYYSKIEEFEHYTFGAIHGIQLKPNYYQEFEDSIYELNFFVGKGFLVTVHTEELFFLETLFERARSRHQVEMKSLENLLYNVFSKVVSSFEFTLEKIDDKIELLEDEILKNPEAENMEDILDTKKVIFAMRKIVEAQQSAYVYFTREINNLIAREYLVYFRDIHTQCARINQAVVIRSQTIVSLIEVYMSSVTVKLTEVMKFLTIITTIVMPVLIVSGYYGMNVVFPEYSILGPNGSWFVAIIIMFVAIVSMLVYFKKKKWF